MTSSNLELTTLYSLAGALALTTSFLAHLVFGTPKLIAQAFVPLIVGLLTSWVIKSPKRMILTTLVIMVTSSLLTCMSLLTPVMFGVFEDPSYINWFTYLAVYRVFGNALFMTFHMLVSGLGGLFLWSRW